MLIEKLTINNFRAKEHLQMEFGSRLTLLVGENGSGKTTILDALAIGLGALLTHLPKVSGISFKSSDIEQHKNNKAPYTRVGLKSINGIEWDRTLRRDQSKKTVSQIPAAKGLSVLKKYIDEQVINPFNEASDFTLPVFSYYGVSRALLDIPLRRRGFPKTHQRFEALENALNSASRFKSCGFTTRKTKNNANKKN
jgi:predicted ATP-binding protein involved in virulence